MCPHNLNEWADRLESGNHDDPLLDLAARLEASRPPVPGISPSFKTGLRNRLMASAARSSEMTLWRPAFRLLALGVLVLAAMGLWLVWPRGIQTASAADILQRANQVYRLTFQPTDVLYDRLSLDILVGPTERNEIKAELWQTSDGASFRYQLTDPDGQLLYFTQRRQDQVWQSFHSQLVGAEAIWRVYHMSLEDYLHSPLWQPESPDTWETLHGDLSVNWAALDRWLLARQQVCADLFCLLGVAGEGWQCNASECHLDLEDGGQWSVTLLENRFVEGREVYVVALKVSDGDWQRQLWIDRRTFELVEVQDYLGEMLLLRLQPVERAVLAQADLPQDWFSSLPAGVEAVDWKSASGDRLWLISATPAGGTAVSTLTDFQFEIGYELGSVPSANLGVYLWPVGEDHPVQFTGRDGYTIEAGKGTVTVNFSVLPGTMPEGEYRLVVELLDFNGSYSAHRILRQIFEDVRWCIGECTRP